MKVRRETPPNVPGLLYDSLIPKMTAIGYGIDWAHWRYVGNSGSLINSPILCVCVEGVSVLQLIPRPSKDLGNYSWISRIVSFRRLSPIDVIIRRK